MSISGSFTREERERIVQLLRSAAPQSCPRCGAALSVSEVRPPVGVPYVRKRVLAVCSGCHTSAAVDLPR